ncbi:MAG: RNA chaperone Hfq [Acidobacteriota bacterium]|jgi:host factor-I protein|nr:RNA chaperone Hfq [Acidobacteriota bacterium]
MDKQTTQNIQDGFLNNARREKSTIDFQLMNGGQLSGKIKSFDKFSVMIDVEGQEFLLFKHAISTISIEKTENKTDTGGIQVKYLGRKTDNT